MKEKFQEQQEQDLYDQVANEMFKPNHEFDTARRDATLQLLHILSRLVMENPSMRFGQILRTYGFVEPSGEVQGINIHWQNEFYLEPVDLLKRVQARLDDLTNSKR